MILHAPVTKKSVGLLVGATVVLAFTGTALLQLARGRPLGMLDGTVLALVVVAAAVRVFGKKPVSVALEALKSLREDGADNGK